MTARIEVQTITLAELFAASPNLSWHRLAVPDDGVSPLEEGVDAFAVAECSTQRWRALQSALPTEPGVYAWSAAGTDRRARDGDRAVLYLGVATGRGGLAGRLGGELRWVRNAATRSPRWRQRWYAGHPRVMLRHDARLHYAVTPADSRRDAAIVARDTERMLLHFARFAAGSVPPVNGSAWWRTGPIHDAAREQAWQAIQRSAALLMPGGPGDFDGGPELADPAAVASGGGR